MEGKITLPPLERLEVVLIWAVLISAGIGLLYGLYLVFKVLRQDPGSREMRDVSAAIQVGARTYLAQQFKTMGVFILVITAILYLAYRRVYTGPGEEMLPLGVAVAFLMGSIASALAGFVGMSLAVRANTRVAAAALKSFKKSVEVAFQAGTVSGMFTVGLGLMGATIIFLIFQEKAMKVLVGFGFGGCLVALFMRIGGGIFTKAADVGADLVGKVEAGIPEDDPRNAATIADNVGDNVGDCAGMAADVFESYEVTLVAAIILAAGAMLDESFRAEYGGAFAVKLIVFPLLVRACGVFASIIGTWSVRAKDEAVGDPMRPINVGFWVSALVAAAGFGVVNYFYLHAPDGSADMRYFAATFMGIILALVIGSLTHYFTHTDKPPVTEIAHATRTGPATMLLQGFASGLESSVWAILAIAATIGASMLIFQNTPALIPYGIALSGLGLLTTTGYILAMDTYGPIADNANGIFEMSGTYRGEGSLAEKIVGRLDAVGNVTKALTKGFAIATAVIAAISLFRSFIDESGLHATGIQINSAAVFIGLLIGGAVPFLFSSMAIRAVGRAAFLVVEEVRRQFREIPGIMEGKNKPEYARCVEISTRAAQKELIGPGILAICTPTLVALMFGKDGAVALGGYLAGAILTGQLLAVFMANAGGAWDNAKKKIEAGLFGGKGTEFHKAAIIGDTVGDPFKDTAGPALNPLIKVMNLVGILLAPAVAPAAFRGVGAPTVVAIVVLLLALIFAVWFSKRGSIVSVEDERALREKMRMEQEGIAEPAQAGTSSQTRSP